MILLLLTLTLIFSLGIFLVVKNFQNEYRNKTKNLPPGPWGLPLLGHLVFLGLSPHLTLMKWKKKYGPIMYIRFGSFPTVVLSDSKVIKEVFSMPEFSGRPQLQVFHETQAEKGINLSEGPYNTELRNFATRKLKEFGVGRKKLEDQIHSGISEFINFVKMREGLPVNSDQVPCSHILRTLWSIMMTEELDPEQVEYMNRCISKSLFGSALCELAGFMPWMEKMARSLSLGHFSFISSKVKAGRERFSHAFKLIEKKKKIWTKGQSQGQGQGQGQAPKDIMEMYLEKVVETTDKSSPFHASHGSETYFLSDLFAAGVHTLDSSLVWMFYYAARNPEVQKKLQEEIDEVIGHTRLPSLLDQGQMPYADAFLHEVLRLSSVVPLFFPHKAFRDVRFHGYSITKDTMVIANAYGVHHDPEIWGDPENFRPQRWFSKSGQKLKSDHFFPFGTGRRICVGESLAREQLFLYVTTFFQQYDVDFDLGKGQVPEVKGVFEARLSPSKYMMNFNKREKQ